MCRGWYHRLAFLPYYRHNVAIEEHLPDFGHLLAERGVQMNRIGIVIVIVAGLVASGLIALSAWQIPAPTVAVNKVIPDEKLSK
jgi:hypothetical protein